MPYEDATEMVEAYGEAGTGKSCLLNHFIQNTFKQHSQHTIGVEFSSRTINIGEKRIKLQLWDTAGQERFRSVTRSYYRGAAGALLVYDITKWGILSNLVPGRPLIPFSFSRQTFEGLSRWLADARALASPQLVTVLVGCKSDREEDREVEWAEASRWAAENGTHFLLVPHHTIPKLNHNPLCIYQKPASDTIDLHFLETSALSGDNVEAPFLLAARSILLSIESGQLDPEKAGSGVSYGDRGLRRISSSSRMSFLGGSERRRRRDTILLLRPVKKLTRGECCN
ncbi:related to GTP-binding protein [Serendipita indica DSM 11827]|uniref:Related to GTP-binding protein n=1 Tax=Serendipita indica (strain DSM 11827) TaxID=1109443 RepID=G4U2C5_SERID|nr:related to GTP-binding protein [Serendipita indica DSM 11827]